MSDYNEAEKISEFLIDNSLQLFGHQFVIPSEFDGTRQRKFFRMEIDQKLGIFDMIIKEAYIRVSWENINNDNKQEYWIDLSLKYEHPGGGRNGSNIGTVWLNDEFELLDIRKPGDAR
jgi:hypothetical protein